MLYLTLKWIHLVAVISWVAGLLYLFRLFVYHSENMSSREITGLLAVMERRLVGIITMPAMTIAWIAGLGMIFLQPGIFAGKWLHVKLLLLFAMTWCTIYGARLTRGFREHASSLPSSKKLRFINEIPTVLMIIIVGLAVFRPF